MLPPFFLAVCWLPMRQIGKYTTSYLFRTLFIFWCYLRRCYPAKQPALHNERASMVHNSRCFHFKSSRICIANSLKICIKFLKAAGFSVVKNNDFISEIIVV